MSYVDVQQQGSVWVFSALPQLPAGIVGMPKKMYFMYACCSLHGDKTRGMPENTNRPWNCRLSTVQSQSVKDVLNLRRPREPTRPTWQSISPTGMPTSSKNWTSGRLVDVNIMTSCPCPTDCNGGVEEAQIRPTPCPHGTVLLVHYRPVDVSRKVAFLSSDLPAVRLLHSNPIVYEQVGSQLNCCILALAEIQTKKHSLTLSLSFSHSLYFSLFPCLIMSLVFFIDSMRAWGEREKGEKKIRLRMPEKNGSNLPNGKWLGWITIRCHFQYISFFFFCSPFFQILWLCS